MPDRIVVFLGKHANQPPSKSAESFFVRARDLMLRAKAFGATLCTWHWSSLSFSFQIDDLEEAVGFVTGSDSRELLEQLSVGISQGALELLTSDGEIELGWGPALDRAMRISEVGRPGEVLVDCEMLAVQHVQLVTRGTRSIKSAPKLRAYLVAVEDPFRVEAQRTVERLVEPPLVGRKAALDQLVVSPGTLATVRAAAGFGGTRLLQALAAKEKEAVHLVLQPMGHRMEPLEALRRAMGRRRALAGAPSLNDEHDATWRNLIAGHGADPTAVAELLEAWLSTGEEEGGLLLIDDANEIDSATLDVVATAQLGAEVPFRVIARLDRDSPLPAELAPLPPGPEVELTRLNEGDARALVKAWTGGIMRDGEADVWAQRGGGIPLAIGEALADGLSTGELTWGDGGARPRSIPPRVSTPRSAASLVLRRMRFLTPGSRAVLHALATLGGDAPARTVAELLESAADIPVDLELEQDRLGKAGWLRYPEPGWLALPCRTQLRMIEQSVPDTRRAAWHRAASGHIEKSLSLALAEAAWHAVAANDRARAQRLAKRAASIAEAAGLENAARDLHAFARAHDPAPQPRVESDASGLVPRPPMASSPGDPEDIFPVALAARGPKRPSRFTFPPVEVPEGELLSEPPSIPADQPDSELPCLDDDDLLPPSSPTRETDGDIPSAEVLGPEDIRRSLPDDAPNGIPAPPPLPRVPNATPKRPTPPGTVRRPKLELLFEDEDEQPDGVDVDSEPPTIRLAPARPPMDALHELTAEDAFELVSATLPHASTPSPMPPSPIDEALDSERTIVQQDGPGAASEATSEVVQLMRSGAPEAVQAWAKEMLEQGPVRRRVVERVRALTEPDEQRRSDAIRVLRNACEQARSMSAIEQSRSRLAFALGLASAGRPLEALVEALEALSRARQAGDGKAERACLAFLRRLYETQRKDSLEAWEPRIG